jgi:hypothetical protein
MSKLSRTVIKNTVVAATIGLAAVASWAFTEFRAPVIEVAITQSQQS